MSDVRRYMPDETEVVVDKYVNDSAIDARREGCVVVIDDDEAPR